MRGWWVITAVLAVSGTGVYGKVTAPSAVEAAAQSQTHVRIYWTKSADAAEYVVYRDGHEIGHINGTVDRFDDTTAQPAHTYRYEVEARNSSGATARGRAYVERTFETVSPNMRCDVLVVGATTAGVAAAVTSGRYGLNVILTEESRRIGGMPVNGLGITDLRRITNASGLFEEFRRKVAAIYGKGDGLTYEPRVAHQAMKEIVWDAPDIHVYREMRPVKVDTRNGHIHSVTMEDTRTGKRSTIEARIVIDATECGDVAAWAGAPFMLGREARSVREPHAGMIYYDRAKDAPLPGSTGNADKRLQAYAYLMTVKDYGPGADKTIPQPPGYDVHKYDHATPWEKSWAISSGRLPNLKYEVNQHPQGSDLQVVNYSYPTGSYSLRKQIEEQYRNHALGYLYYLQTVEGHRNIGLSDDDYRDGDGWPQLLYIREARRFTADHVIDEHDITTARDGFRHDVIGIADYPMDSHAAEQKTDWSTGDMGEGEFYLPQHTPWNQVPYAVMIPKRVENLYTPTAVSATHVAYGTLRLEPVRMHFGTAAGVGAYLAITYNLAPRTVPAKQIQLELLKHNAGSADRPARAGIGNPGPSEYPTYLYMFADVTPTTPQFTAIQWLGARGYFPCPAPEQKTPSTVLLTAAFQPAATLNVGEAIRTLGVLSSHTGSHTSGATNKAFTRLASHDSRLLLTRAEAAKLIAEYMEWTPTGPAIRYSDLVAGSEISRAAEALREHHIDSILWDQGKALTTNDKLIFAPETPMTRAQWAQIVYLAAMHLSNLWEE